MPTVRLAFDKSSVRTQDADGRVHVESSRISIAAVNPYYGKEIPGYDVLGLDANKVYNLLRDPVELERGAETFARLNILSDHVPVTVDSMHLDPSQKKLIIGNIGSNVTFDGEFLNADLCFFDATAIKGIERGTCRELSCAYRYVPVMESGTYKGKAYDGRMTQIQGNHLALVAAGRAGPDVVVADRNPFKEPDAMKQTKFGKAIFAMLCAASPALAADAALPALVLGIEKGKLNRDELAPKLLAMDATLDAAKLGLAFDAMADMDEPNPKPKLAADESDDDEEGDDDETKAAKAKRRADKAEKDKPAMDAAISKGIADGVAAATAAIHATNDAVRHVRPTVGDIVVAMDSASSVYGFALDKLSVKHDGITDPKALRAMYDLAAFRSTAPTPRVAMDAANVHKLIPGLARIRPV